MNIYELDTLIQAFIEAGDTEMVQFYLKKRAELMSEIYEKIGKILSEKA